MIPRGTLRNKLEIFSVDNIKTSEETKIFGAFIESFKTLPANDYNFSKLLLKCSTRALNQQIIYVLINCICY